MNGDSYEKSRTSPPHQLSLQLPEQAKSFALEGNYKGGIGNYERTLDSDPSS